VAQKSIKDKEDILHMLRDKALDVKIGINLRSDIKDVALPDLRKTVEELASEGKILVVRTNDQNKLPHTIYLNNPEYDTKVDERFTTMWQELRLPPEREMYYDLQQGGHKVSMPVDPIIHDQVDTTKKKKKSQGQRRVKLTNVHLEGIDLSQDYIPNKH
jgi:transcription initiation factor TFIIE subunit beta